MCSPIKGSGTEARGRKLNWEFWKNENCASQQFYEWTANTMAWSYICAEMWEMRLVRCWNGNLYGRDLTGDLERYDQMQWKKTSRKLGVQEWSKLVQERETRWWQKLLKSTCWMSAEKDYFIANPKKPKIQKKLIIIYFVCHKRISQFSKVNY